MFNENENTPSCVGNREDFINLKSDLTLVWSSQFGSNFMKHYNDYMKLASQTKVEQMTLKGYLC